MRAEKDFKVRFEMDGDELAGCHRDLWELLRESPNEHRYATSFMKLLRDMMVNAYED